MALLDMLVRRGYQVLVAHVNYNLRDDTSEDYRVVSSYCRAHQIPFFYRSFTREDYQKGNFQAQARRLRYDFYRYLYRHYKVDAVLLGHHCDDVLETIYMYLERGTRTSYLGIRAKTMIQDMVIIRPLLEVNKADLRAYCDIHHISYHDDYTNFETHYTRDKIRNTILNTYTEKEKQALLDHAAAYNARYQEKQETLAPFLERFHKQGYIDYHEIPSSLLRDFLYEIIEEALPGRSIGDALIREMRHQILSAKPNIQMQVMEDCRLIKEYDHIYLTRMKKDNGYAFTFDHWSRFSCDYFSLATSGPVDYGIPLRADDFPITIRSFHQGDKIKTKGGTKKVSRLFIDAKIPALKRQTWPIVLNKDGMILIVPGIAKNMDHLSINPTHFVIK